MAQWNSSSFGMRCRFDANCWKVRPIRSCPTTAIGRPNCSPRYLESEHIDAVYASPLRTGTGDRCAARERSRDSTCASPPASPSGTRTAPSTCPVEELKAANDPRWHAMLRGEWAGDESEAEFEARVLTAMNVIIADHGGQRVAVVCHGGIINGYLAHVLGLPAFSQMFFYPNYTSINRVAAATSGQRSIVTINETSHLRGTGLPMGLFQQG